MSSYAEVEFITRWKVLSPHLELTEEFRFHPARRWRFDFCHMESRTAIEIEGGIHSGGRHTRGYGYRGDMEKYNQAAFLGWIVIRLSPDMITDSNLQAIQELISLRLPLPKQAIESLPVSQVPKKAPAKRRTQARSSSSSSRHT